MSSEIPKYVPPSPYTPFLRRFTDERARDLSETIALYREVRAAHLASPWSGDDAVARVSAAIATWIKDAVTLPSSLPLCRAFDRCQEAVLGLETTIFKTPEVDWDIATLSLKEQVDLRRFLRAQEHFLAHDDRVSDVFATAVANVFAGILHEMPALSTGNAHTFSVPMISLHSNPGEIVDRVIGTLCKQELADVGLFATLQQKLLDNVYSASGVPPGAELRKPLITADVSSLPPSELIDTYLQGTPFHELFLTPVPFVIPKTARFEHTHIIGGTGHGKTQLLQSLMLTDFDDPDRPAVVALDSQGDMIRTLAKLARFDPRVDERVVILDPSDYEWPLRLNMFHMPHERIARMKAGAREQLRAGIIELYDYIFGALLAADMTQKQAVVFRYLAALMMDIPQATIQTLRQLLEDPTPFVPYIERLTGTTRAFFDNEFSDKSFIQTRKQILRRLYGVLSNPVFERMFSQPENAFDMKSALDSGKVVLINTAKDVLKSDASSMFGRYCIALVMQAALERAADPKGSRRAAFVYVDEAADYFDQNIDTLLIQARKYNVGVTVAHQHLDQLTPALRASVLTNPAIRFAGGLSDRDARSLASDMRTKAEFLLSTRKRNEFTEFACYIRNVTSGAVQLSVELGRAERETQMPPFAFDLLITRSRAAVAAPLAEAQAHIDASTKPMNLPAQPPAENDKGRGTHHSARRDPTEPSADW